MEANAAFVSYSRKDSAFVQKLVKDLKAGGASVWLDKADIDAGTEWDRAVQHALSSCQQMLLVLSPTSAASDNVLDEITVAIRTRKTILPILYQDCEIPIRVSRLQYIDFRDDYSEALADLLRQLKAHQERTSAAAPGEATATEHAPAAIPAVSSASSESHPADLGSGHRKSKRWIWATIMAVLVMIWAVVHWANSGPDSQDSPAKHAASANEPVPTPEPAPVQPAGHKKMGVDLQLRNLMGASADDATSYLGPPDQWVKEDNNKISRYYWKRSLTLELDGPNGHVDMICFERPEGDFTGSSGEPVHQVAAGMTKSEIQAVLGSPSGGAEGYSFYDSPELPGRTLEVDWAPADAGVEPAALRVCINKD